MDGFSFTHGFVFGFFAGIVFYVLFICNPSKSTKEKDEDPPKEKDHSNGKPERPARWRDEL